jgi:outer membrane protein TolC
MYFKKCRQHVIAGAFILSSCSLSFAQTANKVSLKQAIDSAIKNYPELNVKQLEMQSANAAVRDAKDQRLPSLNVSDQVDVGTANGLGGSYFPMGIIPSTSGGITAENNSNVFSGNIGVAYMEHELYNFGLNKARIESAKSLASSSKADYDATTYSLQFQISQLFFDLLK